MRRLVAIAVGSVLLASTGGCRLSNLGHLQLTKDNRLSFTSPAGRELVRKTPLTVSWSMKGPVDGSYAVFVDRAPISVGEDLKAVAKDDRVCRKNPACPDPAYLRTNGVYVTTTTSVTLPLLPPVSGVGDEQHIATVVLLDASGHRRSESAWSLEFRFPRRSSS